MESTHRREWQGAGRQTVHPRPQRGAGRGNLPTGLARSNRVAQRSELATKLFKMIMASPKPNVGLIRANTTTCSNRSPRKSGQWSEKVDLTADVEVHGPPAIREVTVTLTELPDNGIQGEIIDVEPVAVDARATYRAEPGSPEARAPERENQRREIERITVAQHAR
ncbi:MAG: hypothetical protein R2843_08610 [Thermomicrobiales bacterium]